MKKIFNTKFSLALAFASLLLSSCDDKGDATGYSNLIVAEGVVGTINLDAPLAATQTVREGDQGVYTYNITLNKTQPVDIHIKISQIDGNADDHDFEFTSEIVIPAYTTVGVGEIKILNDADDEDNETFKLRIGDVNTSNAQVTSQELSFTIIDCYSDLAGTYDYVTTNCYTPGPPSATAAGPFSGTVTFAETADAGVYALSDASFGGWIGLYGPGNVATGVKFVDLCGEIAYSGVDQYNEVFTFSNLVINGSSMSFHWENDYGEYGDTTLTRPDGSNWPNLTLQQP
ncbi:MAG: hypothetical protein FGM16_05860 [Flavobacterium sp.]|nr:hypothetical protein [Flavobacterium sp.]